MIQDIKQDIFAVKCDGIIHQANCFNTMGSGIARYIRENFPEAYQADCKTKKGDRAKLGHASVAKITKPLPANPDLKFIFNLYGQYDMGNDKRYTDYNALADGLTRIKGAIETKNKTGLNCNILAVPYRMGSNRGGGDWRIVRAILESTFADDKTLTLIICENPALESIQNKVSK